MAIFDDLSKARSLIAELAPAVSERFDRDRVRFNFVGGEPAVLKTLPDLIEFCREIGAGVSFVSNGMVLRRFEPHWIADCVDIMGISIDFDSPNTNLRIGRATRSDELLKVDFIRQRIAEVRGIGQGTTVKVNNRCKRHEPDRGSVDDDPSNRSQ